MPGHRLLALLWLDEVSFSGWSLVFTFESIQHATKGVGSPSTAGTQMQYKPRRVIKFPRLSVIGMFRLLSQDTPAWLANGGLA